MSHPTTEEPVSVVPAEVRDFVAEVRVRLADLPVDEQQELTAGLEADVADLVAERGVEILGDPGDYARELRVAAGHLPDAGGVSLAGRGVRAAAMDAMDAAHTSWDRLLDSLPGDPRGFLVVLQPAWWVLRAAVAWLVAQDLRGPYLVLDGPWLVVLGVFLVVSVQLGRGRWGVAGLLRTSLLARLALVGLNVFAVTMVPGSVDRLAWHVAEQRAWQFDDGAVDVDPHVITYRGGQACVLEVRDAAGEVIEGAYVWDATGERRLPMRTRNC